MCRFYPPAQQVPLFTVKNKPKKKTKCKFKPRKVLANEYADELRGRLTRAEKYFKKVFEKTKVILKSQKIIYKEKGFYIADFFVPSKFLCVEIDGGYHTEPEQILKDQERDKYLTLAGYFVWRMTNEQALKLTVEEVISKLGEYPDRPPNKVRILAPAEEQISYRRKKIPVYIKRKRKVKRGKPIKTQFPHLDAILRNKERRESLQRV